MLYDNASSFTTAEFADELPLALRVILVLSVCIVSTLGNIIILVIFSLSLRGKGSYRCRVIDIIIASLAVAALCRGFLLGPIRTACFINGSWPLGDSVCQLQAYFEAMFRNVILWYLSLLSIERYTKHIAPHDYLVTFSPLTVNIILPGTFLIVIVQVTGPLYGWGKYAYIQDIGLCGAATTSTFGCSYALYILFSLILPPFFVIIINSLLLSSLLCKKTHTEKKNLVCGNSHMLSAENEVLSLIILMVLYVIFSIPRCVADVTLMCSRTYSLLSSAIFSIYFLDSLTDLLLPLLCLGMHPRSRKLLFEVFMKSEDPNCTIEVALSSSNQ